MNFKILVHVSDIRQLQKIYMTTAKLHLYTFLEVIIVGVLNAIYCFIQYDVSSGMQIRAVVTGGQ
jgi:hypothetical protein